MGPVAPAMGAAARGKRVLYACDSHGEAIKAWKRAKAYDKRYGLDGKFIETRRLIEFASGGFMKIEVIRSGADVERVRGLVFDMANDYAMEWTDVAARVRP